jgi:hypothetical protein
MPIRKVPSELGRWELTTLPCSPAGMPILWALADSKIGERRGLAAMLDVEPKLATTCPGLARRPSRPRSTTARLRRHQPACCAPAGPWPASTARNGRGHITLHLPEAWHREQAE